MNGIIYCRVSSKEQIEGTSLESQEVACRDYADAHNINILRVFVERGESAKFADRTQLIELLNFCRDHKGQVETLLVWKIDRFARNVGDHFNIKATLLKHGVRVVSVTEPIDSNPEGKLLETMLAGFAQFDNDIRAMRSVQGMQRKLQEGIFPWGAPMGYRSANRGEKKTQPDIPDQPAFGLLQKAWQEFATGAYSKAEIGRLMANWGVLSRRGSGLGPQTLDQFFRNPFYTGILVNPWTGQEHDGKHLPMVSREDFAKVQLILARRGRKIHHQIERPEFPLRGLVRCSSCRQYMTGSFSRGRSARYAYYHCNRPQCGHRASFGTTTIHDDYLKLLRDVSLKSEHAPKLRSMILHAAEDRLSHSDATKSRRALTLDQLARQLKELIDMRSSRLITDEEFRAHKRIIDAKRTGLQGAPAAMRLSMDVVSADVERILASINDLPGTWERLPLPARRRFDHLVLPVGFVNGESRTAELGRLFRLSVDLQREESSVVPPSGNSWNRLLQEIADFAALFRSIDSGEPRSNGAVP